MRARLDELLAEITLVTLALAIVVGYSLLEFVRGLAIAVEALTTHTHGANIGFSTAYYDGGGMTWVVGHHVVALDALLVGVIELAASLFIAWYVTTRLRIRRDESPTE